MYTSILLFGLMTFTLVLFYFRTRGIKQNLSKILYYDYNGYSGENPDVYFSTASFKVKPIDQPLTIETRTANEGISTERQMVDDNILQLKENRDDSNTKHDVVINTDFNPNLTDGVVHNIKCDGKLGDMVSIPDYEELHPKELLKYDSRTTMAYLRDMLIVEHSVLSLVFRKSLKDPLFIRVWMLVFYHSMQFAFNALVYTDAVIDQRQVDQKDVFIY
jgi:hypothetical protein